MRRLTKALLGAAGAAVLAAAPADAAVRAAAAAALSSALVTRFTSDLLLRCVLPPLERRPVRKVARQGSENDRGRPEGRPRIKWS